MVCYAPRLEPELASAAPCWAPYAPRARAPLFLVREALPVGDGYTALPPEGEVQAAALPESDGDVLDALEEEIVVLSAHIHAAVHRLLTLIARYDQLRGWELAGHRSCAHWLAYRTGLDLGTAREKVRAARALERLPETSAAMARGELSFSQVRALSRVATADNEKDLLELARGCTTAQLERMVRAFRRGTEADEAEAEKRRYQSRTLSVFPDDDGMYVVRGRLTAEEGALLMRAIEAAGDALYREERWPPEVVKAAAAQGHVLETETEREAAQRRADALGLVAERALAAGFGGRKRREAAEDEAGGDAEGTAGSGPEGAADVEPSNGIPVPISGSRAERYQVVLHVEAETLRPAKRTNPWEPGERSGRGAPRVSPETCAEISAHASHEPSGPWISRAKGAGAGVRETAEGTADATSPETGSDLSGETWMKAGPLHPSLSAPRSELDDGTRIAATTSQRLCCDASVVRLTKGADGSILDVGRRTRTIPPALRRALEARDRGCRFPGCGSRFTDAHHVIPWAAGGDTSLGNCTLLCKYHHRLVHEGGWTVDWWGEGRPVFYDPRGGVHCEVRWEAPKLCDELAYAPEHEKDWAEAPDPRERLLETLIQENQERGVEPDPWALGARWKREEDIPDSVYFGAMEALS
jgi:hypothetical protein